MEQSAGQKQPVAVNVMPPMSIYINSFAAGLSTGDIFVILQRNGMEIGTLNMSYTVAKSLGEALNKLIVSLEERSDRKIMTSNECAAALSKDDTEMGKLQ